MDKKYLFCSGSRRSPQNITLATSKAAPGINNKHLSSFSFGCGLFKGSSLDVHIYNSLGMIKTRAASKHTRGGDESEGADVMVRHQPPRLENIDVIPFTPRHRHIPVVMLREPLSHIRSIFISPWRCLSQCSKFSRNFIPRS